MSGERVSTEKPTRRGLTLLEVIVVVVCLLVVAVLLIPWLYSTRGVARNINSRDNLERLSRASLESARVNAGRMPFLVGLDGRSWTVQLLPYLTPTPAARRAAADNVKGNNAWLPVFAAPDDPRAGRRGTLSYAANGGYGNFRLEAGGIRSVGTHTAAIDLDDDGEVSPRELMINYSTGVVWRPGPNDFAVTRDFITEGDGLEYTMLLAENFDAGHWLSKDAAGLAFVIGRHCLTFEGGPAGPNPLKVETADLGPFAVGAFPNAPDGAAPRPLALPGEPVNFAYCDGSVRPVAVDIDQQVYARLMTPNGVEYGEVPLPPEAQQ